MRYLNKHGLKAKAGQLTVAMSGGVWSGERKFEAGLDGTYHNMCQSCHNRFVQSDFHYVWDCPALVESGLKAITASQSMLRLARDGHEQCPAYWLRGMVPAAWTAWRAASAAVVLLPTLP